ncbi:hypothetical protein [Salinithrix halophila]|uniref:Heparinase II/III-like protein n=1 Tax=Salinithrix halophila TaxID=1485204 RepID=A0ABV8JIU2_9BACL
MKGWILLVFLLFALASTIPFRARAEIQPPAKTRTTWYTANKVANARRNIEKYDWARETRDNAVQEADKYLAWGAERLWKTVTPQSLPRSFAVNLQKGSPITGEEFNKKYGYRGWLADPKNEPWKLTDPSSGYRFPTNDFASYYESGLDEHGIFDPKRADKRFLKNELYPERGENWGVDDGTGWVDREGNRWTFVAYYNHWHIWHGGVVDTALRAFRDAYIYTGDLQYARIGTILLDRIADVYPAMDLSAYDPKIYLNSHGGTGKGKIRGSIWEATAVTEYLAAYDAFFPGMEASGAVDFLREKAGQYRLENPKDNMAAVRKNIEDGLFRQIFPSVKEAKIRGNFGMHQRTLAMAAVVLDEPETSEAWIDWIFQYGQLFSHPDWRLTGGNVLTTLVDQVDRDGFGDEPSTQYNSYWLGQIRGVADILEGYDRYPEANLYKNPKFKKMFDTRWPLIMGDRYTPTIGDSFKSGNPRIVGTSAEHVRAFETFGDPVYAQAAHYLNGQSLDGLHGDIFSPDPEKVKREIGQVISSRGTLNPASDNRTGFGFAALRDGRDLEPKEGLSLSFSDLTLQEAGGEISDHQGSLYLETDEQAKRIPEAFQLPEDYFADSETLRMAADREGKQITFSFRTPKSDRFWLNLDILRAVDHGQYKVILDGNRLGEVDFFGDTGKTRPISLGSTFLDAGKHTLSFINIGKNKNASGYGLGLSRLLLQTKQEKKHRIQSAQEDNKRGLWLYYGRNIVGRHGHKDTLNLGFHAFGLDLSPDLGYPADFKTRTEWVSNTVSHNTVVVDKGKQKDHWVGIPRHFEGGGKVQIADVEAPRVYPQTERYRRTTAMVKIDENTSYAVDFFRIKGGQNHHFSFHGAEGDVTTGGLDLIPQETGTYAGPDVPFGQREPDQPEGWNYAGSGFHYLTRVERDEQPASPFFVDWKVKDTWNVLPTKRDIHLRLTMLNPVNEVALADGQPPNLPGNPDWLRYLIARRSGNNLESQFISLIEAYEGERQVRQVKRVSLTRNGKPVSTETAAALKVELADGRVDTLINSLDPDAQYTVDGRIAFRGFFGFLSEKGGTPLHAFISDGTTLWLKGRSLVQHHRNHLEGTVIDFTRNLTRKNRLLIKTKGILPQPNCLIGRYLYVNTDGERNAVYRIQGIRRVWGNRYIIDLGDTTLIRRYKNPEDENQGFIPNIQPGAKWRIPLAIEWHR